MNSAQPRSLQPLSVATFADAVAEVRANHFEHAEATLREVIAVNPGDHAALHLLGGLLCRRGQRSEGIARYMDAVSAAPGVVAYCASLGAALIESGSPTHAVSVLRMTLELHPAAAELHSLLGNALELAGDAPAAVAAHSEAVSRDPSLYTAWANLANAHLANDNPQSAAAALDQAISLRPDDPELWHNRSVALLALHRWQQAEYACRRCLGLCPTHVHALANLGVILKELSDYEAAEATLRRAIEIDPGFVDSHWNLSLLLLAEGRYAEGFAEYEWRRQIPALRIRQFSVPAWDGTPQPDKTLLLHTEQGLGDTLQFIRFVALARTRVGRVVLACPPSLRRLIRSCEGIDALLDRPDAPVGDAPLYHIQAPLLSLPHLLQIESTSPSRPAYLHADATLVEHWRHRLDQRASSKQTLKVGLAWQGSPSYRADERRSLPLATLLPLSSVPGVHLYSLQKHFGHEQLALLNPPPPIVDLGPELDEDGAAFLDSAAVLSGLDLLVTSDSAIAHLAGGLGVEVWLLLAHRPDWRWGNTGEATPWYPRMRLFRQRIEGNWSEVVHRVAAELARRSQEKGASHVDHR